jgi:transmembrane sensor
MNEELNENSPGRMQDAYRVGYLIAGYLKNSLTDAERDELDEWVTASDENMRLFAEMTDEKNIEKGLKERGLYDADKAVERLKTRINAAGKRHRPQKVSLYLYGAAACLVLLAGLFFFVPFLKEKEPQPAITAENDLLPGSDRAVLHLPDGRQIVLDNTHGNILQQGGQQVINDQKTLRYNGQSGEVTFHTLTTPKGGQYQLVLPDGSKVWLNASSSIRFPTAFNGKERRIDITGEAYFEVAHDPSKPFRVQASDVAVEVLGTHFNVAAYADEEGITTTLLEGSVKVSNRKGGLIIQPGQQAIVMADNAPTIIKEVDLDEVMGWKAGLFEFKDEPIEAIMRDVARWYNAEVKYEGKINYHFNASIERDVPVSKLLQLLELTNRVHFTIQDKTIIVKP